jgi:hypothetical protein
MRCSAHRTEGMINVQNKTCQYDGPGGCTTLSRWFYSSHLLRSHYSLLTYSSYGIAGPDGKRGMAIRCKAHKVTSVLFFKSCLLHVDYTLLFADAAAGHGGCS